MRLWLGDVEISASTTYELPPPEPVDMAEWERDLLESEWCERHGVVRLDDYRDRRA